MAKNSRNLVIGATLAGSILTAMPAAAKQDTRLTLVLHLSDYSQVRSDDLADAKMEVARIYDTVGIRAVFVAQGAAAPESDRALHLRIVLLSREMAERKVEAEHVGSSALGMAGRETGYAYILTHRAMDVAEVFQVSRGVVLGKVLAHEIGHMVLPIYSHSPSGIMRADVDLQHRFQGFTAEQGDAIRTLVAADIAARQ
jgi:hypothetical protein